MSLIFGGRPRIDWKCFVLNFGGHRIKTKNLKWTRARLSNAFSPQTGETLIISKIGVIFSRDVPS